MYGSIFAHLAILFIRVEELPNPQLFGNSSLVFTTPLKSLFGFDAINITLGLPFIRISPDHGPNHIMIGKNLSNPLSLIRAIKFLEKN